MSYDLKVLFLNTRWGHSCVKWISEEGTMRKWSNTLPWWEQSNCNLSYLTSLSWRLMCPLVSKSSLIIQKLVFSAFHHLSQAHIYNSKSLQMDVYPPLLIPAKHRVQTKAQAQLECEALSRKWSENMFSLYAYVKHVNRPVLVKVYHHFTYTLFFPVKLTSLPGSIFQLNWLHCLETLVEN